MAGLFKLGRIPKQDQRTRRALQVLTSLFDSSLLGPGLTISEGTISLDLGDGVEISGTSVVASLGDGLTISSGDIVVNYGTGLQIVAGVLLTKDDEIDHDALLNFVAAEHIDWTSASEDLSTSGSGTFDTLLLEGGSITDSSGTISFGDENLELDGEIHFLGEQTDENIISIPDTGVLRFGGSGQYKPQILVVGDSFGTGPGRVSMRYGSDGLRMEYTNGSSIYPTLQCWEPDHLFGIQSPGSGTGTQASFRFKGSTNPQNLYWKGGIFFERTGGFGVGKFIFCLDKTADSGNVDTSADTIMEWDGVTFDAKDQDFTTTGTVTGGNAKCQMTPLGGYAVKLTNNTGSASVAGQLVRADTADDDAVILTADDDDECLGVFLDDDIADGEEAWVVIAGIADVLFDDNVGPTHGDWAETGTAGYANAATSPAAAPEHFREIGHCIETVAAGGAGTHVLGRCVLHFN